MSQRFVLSALALFALGSAVAPTAAKADDALVRSAKAAVCGPELKGVSVNHHDFNVKKATIGKDSRANQTVVVSGQISHRLAWRPDDQIYYTINYKDGVPNPATLRIDRGGVAVVLDEIMDVITFAGLTNVDIFGTKISLKPEKLPEISTQLSKLVEGSGWEEQAAAIIAFIGITATLPEEEVCPEPSAGGGGASGGGRGDGRRTLQN